MKLQIVSDLHREVGIRDIKIVGDILILAGDITSAIPDNVTKLKEWLTSLDIPVLYVLGNHEYYRGDTNYTLNYFREAFMDTNVTILNDDIVEYPESDLVIIGSTLWTDIPISQATAVSWGMRDFQIIKNMNLTWWGAQFYRSKSYINYMLKEHSNKKHKVVITHHSPSFKSIPERFKGDSLNGGFSSDLSDLMLDREPTLWVHGHTHDSFDYMIGNTRVVCNPYGYSGFEVNREFKEDFIVEI